MVSLLTGPKKVYLREESLCFLLMAHQLQPSGPTRLHCYVSLIPCCMAKLSLLFFCKMVEENVVYSDITYVSVLQ